MKKLPKQNLNDLFAAISAQQALYLPADDAAVAGVRGGDGAGLRVRQGAVRPLLYRRGRRRRIRLHPHVHAPAVLLPCAAV